MVCKIWLWEWRGRTDEENRVLVTADGEDVDNWYTVLVASDRGNGESLFHRVLVQEGRKTIESILNLISVIGDLGEIKLQMM